MKSKLAPGSMWSDNGYIVNRDGERLKVMVVTRSDETSWLLLLRAAGHGDVEPFIPDIQAAIRTANLDPVFASAVKLDEYWQALDDERVYDLREMFPKLIRLLDANSAAVKGATSDD